MLAELVAFTAYLLNQDLARTTVRTYLAGLRAFARWWEPQGRPLRALSSGDIARFIAWRLETGGSPASANRSLAGLRHFCRWAKRRRRLSRDPMARVRNLPVRRNARLVSMESLDLLLDVIRRDLARRDRAVLLLLLRGGLTPGEVAALRVKDVVLSGDRHELRVSTRCASVPRTLLLDDELAGVLRARLAACGSSSRAYLFSEPTTGASLTVQAVDRMIASYGRAAGLDGLRWPILRRSLSHARRNAPIAVPCAPLSLLEAARRALSWSQARQAPAFN